MTQRIVTTVLLCLLTTTTYASAVGVPELDGTGALAAVALLVGVVAVVVERRRRK